MLRLHLSLPSCFQSCGLMLRVLNVHSCMSAVLLSLHKVSSLGSKCTVSFSTNSKVSARSICHCAASASLSINSFKSTSQVVQEMAVAKSTVCHAAFNAVSLTSRRLQRYVVEHRCSWLRASRSRNRHPQYYRLSLMHSTSPTICAVCKRTNQNIACPQG